jgi:Ring finger domain
MREGVVYAGYVLFPTFVFAVFAYCKCKEENQEIEQARHGRPPTASTQPAPPPVESGIPQAILDSYPKRHATGKILESTDGVAGPATMESQASVTLTADFCDNQLIPVDEVSCSICLIDYQHGDTVQRNAFNESSFTCNHIFHPECIATWVERSRKSECPCCRNPFG